MSVIPPSLFYNHRMPNYRRVKIKGGTYFLTLATNGRRNIFSSAVARELMTASLNYVQKFHPFYLEAYCILPNHVHLLWRMPEDDDNYSMRIGEVKKRFSKIYREKFGIIKPHNQSQITRGESGIWQRRFWEHYIRDEEDLNNHLDYVHYNPVHHGLVQQVKDWPSSSFLEYVNAGNYDINWGEGCHYDEDDHIFGE